MTTRPRSKRQRSVKPWLGDNINDENDGQAANTPMVVQPTTTKKLRTVGPTPRAITSTAKAELGKSTVKKELGKSAFKKEIEKFVLVCIPTAAVSSSIYSLDVLRHALLVTVSVKAHMCMPFVSVISI